MKFTESPLGFSQIAENQQDEGNIAFPALADISLQLAIVLILGFAGSFMMMQQMSVDRDLMKGPGIPITGEVVYLQVFVEEDGFRLVTNSSPELFEPEEITCPNSKVLRKKIKKAIPFLENHLKKNPEYRLQYTFLCPKNTPFGEFLPIFSALQNETGFAWLVAAYSPEDQG